MKTRFWLFAAAALSFAACSQNDDIMEQPPVVTENDFESPDGQVVIQLGTGGSRSNADVSVTRGAYADINDLIGKQQLGIFALGSKNHSDFGVDEYLLLNNVQAQISNQTSTNQDGSEKASLNKISLKQTNGTGYGGVYYYPMSSRLNYSFYGYAPYSESNKVASNKSIIEFADFAANQDILYAAAHAPSVNRNEITVPEKYDQETVFDGYNAKYLRVLKYNHQHGGTYKPWVPNLNFNHKLALLKIYLKPADGQTPEEEEIVKTKQTVHSIKVMNQPKNLQMNILTGEVTAKGAETKDLEGYVYFPTQEKYKFSDTPAGDRALSITEGTTPVIYFLVNPAKEYKMSLIIKTLNTVGFPPERTETFTIKRTDPSAQGKPFEAGKSYAVKLGIFAVQQVDVTASLTDWGEDEEVIAPVE